MKSIRFTPIVHTILLPAAVSLLLLLAPVFTASRASAATDSCTPSGTTYGTDTLTMSVGAAGTYTIWTRMQIPDTANNSVLLKVGGSCYNVGGGSSMAAGSWVWVDTYDGSSANVISASLSAGNNTLVYTGTHAGVEIDRVLAIAQGTSSCTPTGTGDNCTTVTLPSTPSGVTATANSSTSVTVHWNASTDTGGPGLGGYYVFRNGTQVMNITSGTSATDTTVASGTQYTYTVEAYDTSNNVSAASSGASVTTPSGGGAQSPTVSFNAFPTNALLHGTGSYVNTTVTPTSGNTIAQVQLTINGTVVKTLTAAPYNFTFSTTGYHDGTYTITITATDNHGNIGTANTTMIVTNGDLNSDRKVGITDLSVLAGNWQKTSATYTQGDINGDGTINVSDLSLLAGNWNTSW